MFWLRDGRFPELLAGLKIKGQDPSVLSAAKQHSVHVSGTSIGWQEGGRIVQVRAPILGAALWI